MEAETGARLLGLRVVGQDEMQLREQVRQERRGAVVVLAHLKKTLGKASNPRTFWIIEIEVGDHVHTRSEMTNLQGVVVWVYQRGGRRVGDHKAKGVVLRGRLRGDTLQGSVG